MPASTTTALRPPPPVTPEVQQRASELISYMSTLPQYAIRAVATLHVADLVAAGVTDSDELAERCDVRPEALRRVLHYLAVRGFFVEVAPTRFTLSPLGELLRDDHPLGLRPHFDLEGVTHRMEQAYAHLMTSLRTGGPAYRVAHGTDLYDDVEDDPARTAAFTDQMSSRAEPSARALADLPLWSEVREVVDVGGGDGAHLTHLLTRHGHLRGTLVDLPGTAARAAARFAAAGLGARALTAPGSFFAELPGGRDVYLLASILLDWPDEDAGRVLRRCADACTPGSRVLALDWLRVPGANPVVTSHVDVHEMVLVGGRVRTAEEVGALAAQAGLRLVSSEPCGQGTTLAVLAPASDGAA
ncbi:MAG: methyltransferase [Cellulomonas sp.]|uniref:methyltransferase n=1 Tax=Cellulomonas sp. TaxID=40001 RepID=UPI0019E71910|nr:methyltransferase [Cellulomonas sp.]MBF0688251.1 methyltransferase [Cellulomonas sp.]